MHRTACTVVLTLAQIFLSSCMQQAAAEVGHRHEALNLLINSAGQSEARVWGLSASSLGTMCSPVWWLFTHNAAVQTAHCIASCPGLQTSTLQICGLCKLYGCTSNKTRLDTHLTCCFHGCAGILHIPGQMGPGELPECSSLLRNTSRGCLHHLQWHAVLSAVAPAAPSLLPANLNQTCLSPAWPATM